MLDKGGASLKAFAPQLQTTFIKSLSGTHSCHELTDLLTYCLIYEDIDTAFDSYDPQCNLNLIPTFHVDPSKLVRQRGSAALGKLMALNARVDPLLVELATCTQQAEGPAIKASTLEVCSTIVYAYKCHR